MSSICRSSWAGLSPHFQELRPALYCRCWGTADVCLSSKTSPHACHISPHLSNVLLIYTCWAQGCIGIRCTLTASITQQALLLPFKIHLKRLAGANVPPGMDAMVLYHECNHSVKNFTAVAWLGTAGNLWAQSLCFCFCKWAKDCKKSLKLQS